MKIFKPLKTNMIYITTIFIIYFFIESLNKKFSDSFIDLMDYFFKEKKRHKIIPQ